ncbi:thiol:disulfide interchange protein DsbG [Pseudomonas gingeri]|uniref:thiol:disulfide interchange protein DsbG n=1 Tax=Pseudomonas gingeri TaxID=117681 RepID=UPI0015A186C0|nr:thiol:disulfide interchange protein DsbG [Pseudomonas gingeri]NWE25593.1 thiol:disulfide interchange protein DsbG [Pseudomonas gingeri]NWE94433.1 thiol:disulfide interchange protein DsbG [Pseudomonas gingeri]
MSFNRCLLNLSLSTAFGALLLQVPVSQAEELPAPIKSIEAKGAKIIGSFDAPDGLRGYAAQYQNRGMALYLTPDGKHVIAGNLYDADGKDLSQAPLQKLVYAPMAKQVWGQMEQSNWIEDGKKDAPRIVYLFSDPNCPYCNMFWEQARPWVDSGKVQLRHIMVGIIREDSAAKAAALFTAKDPQQALHDHEKAGKGSPLKPLATIPKEIQAKLDANMKLMEDLELSATPSIFYLDDNGDLQQQQGAPSADKLVKILGPK